MGRMTAYIGIDLGAESGRVIVGVLADDRLRMEEVHRFSHEALWLPTGLHWDITGLWREIVAGLRQAAEWARAAQVELTSVGVDTWGVDWALVDKAGELVGLPHAYRDPRNAAAYEEVLEKLGRERIYRTTGIQFMQLNTLYSLYAHKQTESRSFDAADELLFIPDLLHYWLSGKRAVEATIASTSQMIDCDTGDWAREMIGELGLPAMILPPIVPPGTQLGTLRQKLAEDTGLPAGLKVVAPASHDTASAVAAVPATDEASWCFVSSGTWSLLGAEIEEPCVSEAAQEASYTNELGIAGAIRFLKNIPGLWLVQECRRDLARRGEEMDYATLTELATGAEAFRTILDPAHATFQSPGEMPRKIGEFAKSTGQPTPEDTGAMVRSCLESLALAYREKLETLESILDRRFEVIHVVGGGAKNELLNQMTADATGRRVVAGPFEATAMGNILVQALALGDVPSVPAMRRIVAKSSPLSTYEPSGGAGWEAAWDRYEAVKAEGGRRTGEG